MNIVVGRSSDTEIDWNIFQAPSLDLRGFAGGSFGVIEGKLILLGVTVAKRTNASVMSRYEGSSLNFSYNSPILEK